MTALKHASLVGQDLDALQPQGASVPTEKTEGPAAHHWRKKPVVVEAMRWPGIGIDSVDQTMAFEEWFLGHGGAGRYKGHFLHIKTLEDGPDGEAKHVADPGDWVIRGVQGEFYPCKPDIFAATYERADAAPVPASPVGIDAADEPKTPSDNPAGEVERLRAALEFYADPISYTPTQVSEPRTAVIYDDGRRARAALEASQ